MNFAEALVKMASESHQASIYCSMVLRFQFCRQNNVDNPNSFGICSLSSPFALWRLLFRGFSQTQGSSPWFTHCWQRYLDLYRSLTERWQIELKGKAEMDPIFLYVLCLLLFYSDLLVGAVVQGHCTHSRQRYHRCWSFGMMQDITIRKSNAL